ncbi:hypothetical protein ARHIZOSPH14_09010 [Agromyces rhizosphaerae]|uniref:HTH araC/xylS-type domain-containing protein n=2 Tax=Agromyces rhizosphaerae TaxID=88374 RepID=A0A9W6CTQ7_9MICO|nr:hypothetical protein ARHIZOSPH14_09010 [Agromyces rhizosphaerae]
MGLHGTDRVVESWRLPSLYSVHLYTYEATLLVDGSVHRIRPGRLSVVPPGALMEFRLLGRSSHLYAHLEMTGEPTLHVPVVRDLGHDAASIMERLKRVAVSGSPARQSAEVWSVLWAAATLPRERPEPDGHPAVMGLARYIDDHLWGSLTVARLAEVARYSPTHLDRLFLAESGMTTAAYVRSRRLATARHLLEHTTQSIPSIAASVGFHDLQAFNKACRRHLGASPRAIRSRRLAGPAGPTGTGTE